MSQDFSNLFSGISGNSSWFSDWSSLKNGSYHKLMKAYYGNMSESNSTSSKAARTGSVLDQILEEKKKPQVSQEVQEANSNVTSGISGLKNSVSTLRNKDTYKDTENGSSAEEKVVSAVKNYVSQYNDTVKAAKKSTMSSQTSHVAGMMRSSAENAQKLAEIGITINNDGTLQLSEGKLKSTDFSKVQQLFSADDIMSYGSQVMSRLSFAGAASSAVVNKENNDTEKETVSAGASSLLTDIQNLTSDKLFEKIRDQYGVPQYNADKIFSAVKDFADNYNRMLDEAESSKNSGVQSNLSHILEQTKKNADQLEKFGIHVKQDGRLKIDEDAFKKSDMAKVQKFFGQYGSSIDTNVSLVDYYLTTQADPTSGYTSEGAYNVSGSNRFSNRI